MKTIAFLTMYWFIGLIVYAFCVDDDHKNLVVLAIGVPIWPIILLWFLIRCLVQLCDEIFNFIMGERE